MTQLPNTNETYHRRSIRLKDYDYSSPGAYFITIIAHEYKCIFGNIVDGEMDQSRLGTIVWDCWLEIPEHFPHLEVEPFVMMPNHIHGVITINENEDDRRGTIYRAPTHEQYGKPVVGSIPTIIRSFKAAVSRRSKSELGWVKVWQRNYYEHIIRNQAELESISGYIFANPTHWANEPENVL